MVGAPDRATRARRSAGVSVGPWPAGTGWKGGRRPLQPVILIVDDDSAVRMMLARLLRTQGYEVLQASDARAAHQVLESGPPDLVISDIVMPGESGIELRRNIARRWPEVPVILISGYSADGPAEFAARTPNTAFVQKPFQADHLLGLVRDTLSGLGGGQLE